MCLIIKAANKHSKVGEVIEKVDKEVIEEVIENDWNIAGPKQPGEGFVKVERRAGFKDGV